MCMFIFLKEGVFLEWCCENKKLIGGKKHFVTNKLELENHLGGKRAVGLYGVWKGDLIFLVQEGFYKTCTDGSLAPGINQLNSTNSWQGVHKVHKVVQLSYRFFQFEQDPVDGCWDIPF